MKRNAPILAIAFFALALVGCGGGGEETVEDEGRLLVVRNDDGNNDVFTAKMDGSIAARITMASASDSQPRWSPDGTKIVFVRGSDDMQRVCIMDANGSNVRDLTSGITAYNPRWLPSGKIAYAAGTGSESEIWVMNADGTDKTRLITDTIGDICPEISPDGGTIAYMKNIGGTHYIYLMNPDGSNQRPLIDSGGGVVIGSLAFTKDGRQIAFVASPAGTKEIFLINSDGSNQRQLTSNSADDFAVNWSPDGSKLLFASNRDGNNELYSMNPDGSGQTRITNNTVSDIPYGWK